MGAAAPIISAATGAIGLFQAAKNLGAADDARRGAASAAQQGQELSNESAQLQLDWAKKLQAQIGQYLGQGYGDPEARYRSAKDQLNLDRGDATGATATALQAAGYRPGDSKITEAVGDTDNAYRQKWAGIYNDIRTRVPQETLQLMAMGDPGTLWHAGQTAAQGGQLGLNAGLGIANSIPQLNMKDFFAQIQPYLAKIGKGSGAENNYLGIQNDA